MNSVVISSDEALLHAYFARDPQDSCFERSARVIRAICRE